MSRRVAFIANNVGHARVDIENDYEDVRFADRLSGTFVENNERVSFIIATRPERLYGRRFDHIRFVKSSCGMSVTLEAEFRALSKMLLKLPMEKYNEQ